MNDDKHYKKTMKIVWMIFLLTLPLLLVAEFFVHPHATFGIDGTRFFYAWFGFASCVVIVLVSKLLGFFIKRKETYYKEL